MIKKYDTFILWAGAASIMLFIVGGLTASKLLLWVAGFCLIPTVGLMVIGLIGLVFGLPGEIRDSTKKR
jgi:hypothetical protein